MHTWGFMRRGRLVEELQIYEKECVDFLILSSGRQILDVSYATTIRCLVEDKVWSFDIFISKLGIVEDKMQLCILESQTKCVCVNQGDIVDDSAY